MLSKPKCHGTLLHGTFPHGTLPHGTLLRGGDLVKLGQPLLLRKLQRAAQDTGEHVEQPHQPPARKTKFDKIKFDKNKMLIGGISPHAASFLTRLRVKNLYANMRKGTFYVSAFGTSTIRRSWRGCNEGYRASTNLGNLISKWHNHEAAEALIDAVCTACTSQNVSTVSLSDVAVFLKENNDIQLPGDVYARMQAEDTGIDLYFVKKTVSANAVLMEEAINEIIATCVIALAGVGASVLLCGVKEKGDYREFTTICYIPNGARCDHSTPQGQQSVSGETPNCSVANRDAQMVLTVSALAALGILHVNIANELENTKILSKEIEGKCVLTKHKQGLLEFAMLCAVVVDIVSKGIIDLRAFKDSYPLVTRKLKLLSSLTTDVLVDGHIDDTDAIRALNFLWKPLHGGDGGGGEGGGEGGGGDGGGGDGGGGDGGGEGGGGDGGGGEGGGGDGGGGDGGGEGGGGDGGGGIGGGGEGGGGDGGGGDGGGGEGGGGDGGGDGGGGEGGGGEGGGGDGGGGEGGGGDGGGGDGGGGIGGGGEGGGGEGGGGAGGGGAGGGGDGGGGDGGGGEGGGGDGGGGIGGGGEGGGGDGGGGAGGGGDGGGGEGGGGDGGGGEGGGALVTVT